MKAILCGLIMLLPTLAIAGGTYGAQSNPPLQVGSERLVPHRGGYWNPAEPGSGYFVDLMPRGNGEVFAFATAYTYTATGQSTFLILQGNLTFATENQRQQEGWIAKLVSPTYEARDGQSFGGIYRPANVTPSSFGSGELVWSTRRTAELRVDGRTTPIRTLHPDDAATEAAGLLSGHWVLQARQRGANVTVGIPGASQQYSAHVVKLTPALPQPTWRLGSGSTAFPNGMPPVWIPPAGVITFTVTCISECLSATLPLAHISSTIYAGARVWIDPVTMRAGWVRNAVANGQSGAFASITQDASGGTAVTAAFDLYVDNDTVIGRGALLIPLGLSAAAGAYPGQELLMTRITPNGLHGPEGTVAKIY